MKTKKFLSNILLSSIIAFVLTVSANAQNDIKYSDVKDNHWAYNAIVEMSSRDIFKGTGVDSQGNARFSPEEVMTRAQFVTALTRYLYPHELDKLEQVPGTEWFRPNYVLACEKGLLLPSEFENGNLDKPCSREEMSMLLVRAAEKGMGETPYRLLPISSISDYDNINQYYKDYVVKAYSMGLLAGVDTKGTFAPNDSLNRAQAATVMYRLIEPSSRDIVFQNQTVSYEWDNGIYYEGEYLNGQANGHGRMTFPNEGTYIGYFTDGLRDGIGTFEWYVGDKYIGNWKNDKMNGYGIYTFADGYEIKGVWEDNQIKATGIDFSIPSTEIIVGQEVDIVALLEPINATEIVEWKSSNEKVLTISNENNICKIKGISVGTAKVTAKTSSETKTCEITVKKGTIPVTQIALNYGDYTSEVDQTFTLKATCLPSNANNKITWTSSNTKVASVNSSGRVKCLKKGEAIISATSENGLIATCYVTVTDNSKALWDGHWYVYEANAAGKRQDSYTWSYDECDIDYDDMTFELDFYPFSLEDEIEFDKENNYTLTATLEDLYTDYEIAFTSISENMIILEINEITTYTYIENEVETTYYVLYRDKQ